MDNQPSSCQGNKNRKQLDKIKRRCRIIPGPFTRYILHTKTLTEGRKVRRERFGEKENSENKTLLMVGETGAGKSTLINAFINHMLGVKYNERIWCEIIETKENQTETQTTAVTVYDVFIEEFPFSLTVIDTPGYGNTGGKEEDINTTKALHDLIRDKDGVHEVDAVCLVVSSKITRLLEKQQYIFDAILSLFGSDVQRNIVLLITHATQKPTHALIRESKLRCAETEDGEPVYFSFDNSHCERFIYEDEDEEHDHKAAWENNERNMKMFFDFLSSCKPVNLKMTEKVMRTREQLAAAISNLKDRITSTELRKQELEQIKAALEQHEKEKKDKNDFQYEVDETYKEKVPIESKWWNMNKEATCCTVCEENCHYPGCWWVKDPYRCTIMSRGKCTVCSGKWDYTKHVKENKVYVSKTRKVKKTNEDLKKKYEEASGKTVSLRDQLENEIRENEIEKSKLVDECYEWMDKLEGIALKTDSLSTLQHIDYLIEKLMETDGNLKTRARRNTLVDYRLKSVFERESCCMYSACFPDNKKINTCFNVILIRLFFN